MEEMNVAFKKLIKTGWKLTRDFCPGLNVAEQ